MGQNCRGGIGKNCLELGYEPWHAAMHDREIEQVVATKAPIRGDVPFSGTGGRRIYDYIFVSVFGSNGEVEAVAGATRDVTERKLAEQRARESEERLRFMAASMPQKIFAAKPDGQVDYFNDRWLEFTGLNARQLENWDWANVVHPDDAEENLKLWQASISSGEPFDFTHRIRYADGTYRWHLSRALAVRSDDGIGSSTEIHEQKRTQEELLHANQDLEQFAYTATHDLQEPLRSVKIYSGLLATRCAGRLDAQGVQFLKYLQEGATRMERLVRDLLSYTQAGRLDTPTQPADGDASLEIALANLDGAITECKAQITYTPLPSLPVHDTHLQQLFQNLIGNAVKYHHPDRRPEIHVTASGKLAHRRRR